MGGKRSTINSIVTQYGVLSCSDKNERTGTVLLKLAVSVGDSSAFILNQEKEVRHRILL